jgi:transcriptional regulator GlxA family with amidase domain
VAKSRTQRYVVVVFDGVSLGIMSFAFGVFDLAAYYGVLPDIDVRIVSGEDSAALTGGGLACPVPYDLDAVRAADLVIIPTGETRPNPRPHRTPGPGRRHPQLL